MYPRQDRGGSCQEIIVMSVCWQRVVPSAYPFDQQDGPGGQGRDRVCAPGGQGQGIHRSVKEEGQRRRQKEVREQIRKGKGLYTHTAHMFLTQRLLCVQIAWKI